MDSIITIIFIWLFITLLNYLSKRTKKSGKPQPAATPSSPDKEKSELPPFLREIFDLPPQEKPPPPTPDSEKDTVSEESIFSIERETKEEYRKQKAAKKLSPPSEGIKSPMMAPMAKVQKSAAREIIRKRKSLKEAVIWKEILDRPVSMKPFLYRRRD